MNRVFGVVPAWARCAFRKSREAEADAGDTAKRRMLAILGAAFGVTASAFGCSPAHSCGADGTCPQDGGDVDTDVQAIDACADDGACRTLGDATGASNPDAASDPFDGVGCDSANDSPVEGCGLGDGDGWVAIADAGADADDVDAPERDGSGVTSFLGTWALAGMEMSPCPGLGATPDASVNARPVMASVTFRAAPRPTGAGSGNLMFEAGNGCTLEMVVDAGVVRLASSPETCTLGGPSIDRTFTSVQVDSSLGSLRITEDFTDPTGCTYLIEGVLTR